MTEVKEAEKKIVVLNQSGRSFTTSAGVLDAGKSLELPESEAKNLLDYHGVIDASKLVKAAASSDTHAAEITKLKGDVAHLHAENQKLLAENKKLKAEHDELKAKPESHKGKK